LVSRFARILIPFVVAASTLVVSARPALSQDTGVTVSVDGDSVDAAQDSTWTRDAFERALRDYYMSSLVRYGGETSGDRTSCNADMRQVCYGGDLDALVCPHGIPDCIPDEPEADRDFMLSELFAGLEALPGDPFIVGQVVYALTKFGRTDKALEIARRCEAAAWWCAVLEGHVLWEMDRWGDAHEVFERAIADMPEEERCSWNDIMPLLPKAQRFDYLATPCGEREGLHKLAWWLADPSWLVEGNERQTGHYARKAQILLHEDLWSLSRGLTLTTGDRTGGGSYDQQSDWREYPAYNGHNAHHALDESFGGGHKGVVAIGFQDSWYHNGLVNARDNREGHWRLWVSRAGARYRFFPDSAALAEPLASTPTSWDLNDREAWERFSPRRTFAGLDHQVAWFQRGDSAVVAASAEIDRDRQFNEARRWAGWVLYTEPMGERLSFVSEQSRQRYTFQADLSDRPYLMGLEVIGPTHLARTRYATSPPWANDAPGAVSVSGLLLYRPLGNAQPTSYDQAVSGMRGSARWETGDQVGLFWEYYGMIPGPTAQVAVRMIPVVDGKRVHDGGEPLVSWTDETERAVPILARSVVLDLGLLDPGRYILEFTVAVPGQRPLVRTAPVVLEGPPGS
jgi:hypothetical protein